MLVVENKSGLGTGFASFVAGHKGQRIILKRGLAPAHTPAAKWNRSPLIRTTHRSTLPR
jgi:hypothetical protein